jgi:hypothetical protein
MKCKLPTCQEEAEPLHDGYCTTEHAWRHTRERAVEAQHSTFVHIMSEKPKKMNGHEPKGR